MALTYFLKSTAPVGVPNAPTDSFGMTGFPLARAVMDVTRGAAASLYTTDATLVAATGVRWGFWAGNASSGTVWVSPAIAAATSVSDATVNLRAAESAAQANCGVGAAAYKMDSTGAVTTIGSATNAIELGTAEAAKSITITAGGSVNLAIGDYLVLVPFWIAQGGSSTTGRTVSAWLAGPTAGASGDAFVTFTEVGAPVAQDVVPYTGGGYYA